MIKTKIKKLFALSLIIITLVITFVLADINYYDPSSTITGGWAEGTGTTHAEIIDTAREPNAPNTGAFVASRMGDGVTSEFRLEGVTDEFVENITLWVYASTGNTAQFTFSLRQGANTVCSNFVPGSTISSWRSCTWTNPSGNLSDLRLHLSVVDRAAGGGPTNAIVYAGYIAVDTGPNPPSVTLQSPSNDNILTGSAANFSFIAQDELYTNLTCYLYGNFTGSWGEYENVTDVQNNTQTTLSVNPSDDYYLWNVMCENEFGRTAFAQNNKTTYVNLIPPSFSNAELNETSIRQNRSVLFNVTITDSYGIDSAKLTLRYPSLDEEEFNLNRNSNNFYYTITNTTNAGTYTLIDVWANDTLGQENNYNPSLSFTVDEIAPTAFDLIYPLNNTESQTLNPTMEWGETSTPDFKNYTLQISKVQSFSEIEQTHYSVSITNTEIQINALDEDTIYYWRVIAYDVFGNQRLSSQVFTYITDNTPPSISLNNPENNTYSTQIKNTFTFTPQDANTIDYCSLYTNSSGSWIIANQTSSPIKNAENILSAEGVEDYNSWNVRCFDDAGNNAFASDNYTLIIDLTPPLIQVLNPANNSIIDFTNIISFEINASDALAEIQSCTLIINGTVYQTKFDVVNNEVYEFEQFLVNDYYSWQVSCRDTNDWESFSNLKYFTIESADNDPPVITLNFPQNNYYSSADDITFNYSVQDATGIDNCSILINDVIANTSFGVETFTNSFFSLSNLIEGPNTWAIQCYDNSTSYNFANTSARTFYVDLTNPSVTLTSPANDAFLNYSNIIFSYTPEDDNLNYCALYTNITGTFNETQRNNNPTSNVQNNFSEIMPNGIFNWNVQCFDLSGRYGFGAENFSISIDTIAPMYQDIVVMPESPVVFNESEVYHFNITWIDNFDVDTVFFEHNFSGIKENTTLNEINGAYNFTISELNAGTYSYLWHANDTINNKNKTNTYTFIVEKSDASINLFLNSTENNLTINEGEYANITGTITKPLGTTISLLKNGTIINEGAGSVSNISLFEEPGNYNITLRYLGNNNYNFAQRTLILSVLDITSPNITLINPSNDSFVSTGITALQYSVSDFSNVVNCSLYVNDTYNQTSFNIVKDEMQAFTINTEENTYAWRVQCFDSYNNEGISNTRTFNAVESGNINISLITDKSTYEEGEIIIINTTTLDEFSNPLITSIETSIINVNTTIPWWNSSWKLRRKIILNETSGTNIIQGVGIINVTNLSGKISSCDEIRIIYHNDSIINEVPIHIYSESGDWCRVGFELNVSANIDNYDKYYVYYNNSDANPTSLELNVETETSFYAQQSGIDEGTPTNIANIIGFNDNNYATMTQGGGTGTHSAHGRAFINQIPGEEIKKVEVRYRYQVTQNSGTWSLRYSVNDGGAYSNVQSGSTIVAKSTSSWTDISNVYSELSWSEINRTRLQGYVTKTGGGTITLYLFWVEMLVTHTKSSDTNEIKTGFEEELIAHQINTTNSNGKINWNFNTKGLNNNNYSIISLAKRIGFSNAKNHTLIELVPDATSPNVTLIEPLNASKLNRSSYNFTYNVFDYNLKNCTLYLGTNELLENITETNLSNGENIFENIYLTYNDYIWNVECVDERGNKAFAPNNFTFKIIVPNPVAQIIHDYNTLEITWDDNVEVDYYNLYETNNYSSFPTEPTTTNIVVNNFTDDISLVDKKFYKITAIIGDQESEGIRIGIYTEELNNGFNLVSLPFYLNNYELKDSENNGVTFSTNNECLLAIWRFDSATKNFEKTDWETDAFIPSTGSEGFQEIESDEGYFFETNTTCNLKIGGMVSQDNISTNIYDDLNLVSFMSAEEKTLPTNYEPRLLVTNPSDSIHTINRFNSSTQKFEVTTYLKDEGLPWGWWPSVNNSHFTKLKPLEGYYFTSYSSATLTYKP